MTACGFSTRRWWTTQTGIWHSSFSNNVSLKSATKVMFRVRRAKSVESYLPSDGNPDIVHGNSKSCGGEDGVVVDGRRIESESRTWSGSISKNMNILQIVISNLSVMLTLGICVITGHVANDVAGPAVISSLIIAAVTSLLSGLCYTEFQTNRSPASSNIYSCFYQNAGEFPAFVVGWNQILLQVCAIAATGRSLSAVLDFISDHQLQAFWVERLPKINLFDANPDLIAFSFVILTTLPFGLGLRWSKRLNYLLTTLVFSVAMLYIILGASYVDSKGWSTHHFLSYESTKLLSGAAIYTCAFCSYYLMTNSKPPKTPKKCVPVVVGVTLTVCFIIYFTVAIVSTLLVQNRNVNSDVTLVEIFQTYDLQWAVYVIGAAEVVCLCLLLLNLANNLNLTTLMLAFDGLIFRCISKKWKPLKTPLVPVLLFGGGAGIAAVLFSVPSLLEVMALPSLIINTIVCVCVLHQRYQPMDPWNYIPLSQDDISPVMSPPPRRNSVPTEEETSRNSLENVNKSLKESGIHINKRDIFPLVKQNSFSDGDGGSSDDGLQQLKPQTSFDSDISPVDAGQDSDTDSSGTDIDVIVAEYKEKLRVATLTDAVSFHLGLSLQQSLNMDENQYARCPTAATGRRVCISVIGLVLAYFVLSLVLVLQKDAVARGNPFIIVLLSAVVFLIIILLVVILRQPQVNRGSHLMAGHELPTKVFQVPFLPWIPAIAAFLNVCMMTNIFCRHWAPGLLWIIIGAALYFLYGIWNSSIANGWNKNPRVVREKIRLQPLPPQPFRSSVLPMHDLSSDVNQRMTEVDTILISR